VRTLRAILPWVVALAILVFLFARIDANSTWSALREADSARYLTIACAFALLWLAIDAAVLTRVFAPLGAELSWLEMARERAATYPLMILSYHLASAALVARLATRTSTSLSRLGGGILLHYLVDLLALGGISLAAASALDGPLASALRPLLGVLTLGAAGLLLAGRLVRRHLQGRPVVEAIAALSSTDIALVLLGRCAWYGSFSIFVWATAACFSLRFSLVDVAARMPLVLAISALPIAPAGLGTGQGAFLVLFEGLGTPPQLFAYALVFGATLIVLRIPLGMLALWRIPPTVAHGRAR
jgi:hypothetical protein